ncbi:MAG: hypothetical protein ACOYN3_08195, partial [Acidimicrobiia bacterium]
MQTRTLTLRELRAGALDLRPLGRGQRPRIRATWQWSHAACARQSDRASATIADWDIDAVLQVGTHVRIDHSTAARACITDATVLQAVRANRFSVARTARVEEAVRWQHEVFTNQDRIFVLSDWAAQSVIHDYGIPASRVVVTGAGANLDHVPTRTNTAPMLLFVGRDWEHKGGPAIVDAFRIARREVPDLELIVVGC